MALIVAMLSPSMVIAQDATPPGEAPADVPVEAPVTDPPPAEPVYDEPVAPEAPPAEEPVWTNTDAVWASDGVTVHSLAPGESRTIPLTYSVTTPRASTTVFVELVGDIDGWSIASPALSDSDQAANLAALTEPWTLEPGTAFEIPVTITAPSVLYADQGVSLRLWSSADGVNGPETGVAWSETYVASFTAVAPVNSDSVAVAGEPNLHLAPGEQSVVTVSYGATTFRTGTTLHATVIDGSGAGAGGWSVESATVEDASALAPGTVFNAAFTVTAPAYVHADHSVTLVVSSDVAKPWGATRVIEGAAVATITASATPANPSFGCELTGNGASCALDAHRSDVSAASLTIDAPAGWSFTVNDQIVPAGGTLDLLAGGTVPASLSIVSTYDGGCIDPGAAPAANLSIDLAYTHVAPVALGASIDLPVPASVPVAPAVNIDPVDFGAIQWNGSAWESASASTTLTIQRDSCGDAGAYDIQMQVVGGEPGLGLAVTGAESHTAGITPATGFGDPMQGPVTIASVSSGFSGAGTMTLHLTLDPSDDVSPGSRSMTIKLSTVNAP